MCCIATDSFDCYFIFFFFNDTATTEIYTLSLHDALPILVRGERPVHEASGHEQPRHAVRLQDEGLASAERIHAGRAGLRLRRSEEHTSELQSLAYLVCRLLLEKKKSSHCLHPCQPTLSSC